MVYVSKTNLVKPFYFLKAECTTIDEIVEEEFQLVKLLVYGWSE